MRLLIVMGSRHGMTGTTGGVVQQLVDRIGDVSTVDVDVVVTDDLDLGPSCPACLSCMTDGEQVCPNFDRTAEVRGLMEAADVVVFATPVHSFHVSASMKRFVDHFAYLIHRPRYFGTPAVLVSTAAGAGHDAALGYLGEAVRRWGFHVVGRLGVNGPGLQRAAYRAKVDAAVGEVAADAVRAVITGDEPAPTMKDLVGFRVARLLVQASSQGDDVDQVYWRERGWFDADWFTERKVPAVPNRMAALIEGRIRSAIEKGTTEPFR